MNLEDTRRIPPPDPDREPLKVNVYERMAKAAAELMPLFPYDSAGAIVPCGAVLTTNQARSGISAYAGRYARFLSRNYLSSEYLTL